MFNKVFKDFIHPLLTELRTTGASPFARRSQVQHLSQRASRAAILATQIA